MQAVNYDPNKPYAVAANIKALRTTGRRAEVARQILCGNT